jgi:hypothetical protein
LEPTYVCTPFPRTFHRSVFHFQQFFYVHVSVVIVIVASNSVTVAQFTPLYLTMLVVVIGVRSFKSM